MKKIIGFFIVLLLLAGGSWFGYTYYFGGETYYTQIISEGDRKTEQSSGETFTKYTYQQEAYTKSGTKKRLLLDAFRTQPLRLKAYLKVKVNPRKGVLDWQEINQSEVPKKALEKIN